MEKKQKSRRGELHFILGTKLGFQDHQGHPHWPHHQHEGLDPQGDTQFTWDPNEWLLLLGEKKFQFIV